MYRPESGIAEEFIDDQEIKDTLAYADANKDNKELILSIIEKAKKLKGISHREASVLLACEDKELIQKVFDLAIKIKEEFYGNRIVMFAPLYLANYCVNGCTYCPYHYKNKHIRRKKLTQEEIKKEVIALQDMGHKRLALETGEDPVNIPIEYVLESIKTIYSIKHKNGAIRRVNVNIAATTVENYKKLKKYYEEQDKIMEEKEYMLLGLRKIKGIKISEFKNKFIDNPIYLFKNELNKLVKEGLLEVDIDSITLTNKGIDLANLVWEEFI